MKRSGPPKRRTPLRASSALSGSKGLKRGHGLRPKPRKPRGKVGPLSPQECCRVVFELDRGRCIVTGLRIPRHLKDDLRCYHHPTPKQHLPAHLRWDPRNVVLVMPDVHANHEAASERIPREKLPQRALDFAAEVGGVARAAMENTHPPGGIAVRSDPRRA